jgi:2-amino-4-hydroxy-6-hydroxymethyldihydropteridine diphosphokinase
VTPMHDQIGQLRGLFEAESERARSSDPRNTSSISQGQSEDVSRCRPKQDTHGVTTFVVGLGSNEGSRAAMIGAALELVGATPGLAVGEPSPLYITPPLGGQGQPYLNAAVCVEGAVAPMALLARLLEVERALGRVRTVRFSPRTVDLDILWAREPVRRGPELVVPHPALEERPFALAPLLDVAPELEGRYGPALARLGGPPPVARDPRSEGALDVWDQVAAELEERLGSGAVDRPAPGPRDVRVIPSEAPEPRRAADELLAHGLALAREGWGIARIALGPRITAGVCMYLVGAPRG